MQNTGLCILAGETRGGRRDPSSPVWGTGNERPGRGPPKITLKDTGGEVPMQAERSDGQIRRGRAVLPVGQVGQAMSAHRRLIGPKGGSPSLNYFVKPHDRAHGWGGANSIDFATNILKDAEPNTASVTNK